MVGKPFTAADVADWRDRARLTQGELARYLGVSNIAISRWESGRSPVPGYLHLALAELWRHLDEGSQAMIETRRQNTRQIKQLLTFLADQQPLEVKVSEGMIRDAKVEGIHGSAVVFNAPGNAQAIPYAAIQNVKPAGVKAPLDEQTRQQIMRIGEYLLDGRHVHIKTATVDIEEASVSEVGRVWIRVQSVGGSLNAIVMYDEADGVTPIY